MLYMLHMLFDLLGGWLAQKTIVLTYKGINLCETANYQWAKDEFIEKSREALDLIEQVDFKRFKRVQKYIIYIKPAIARGTASHLPLSKGCLVDWRKLDFKRYPRASLVLYSAVLIHEATHGYIQSKGIRYRGKIRLRIEKLCHLEEARFVKQAVPNIGESWIKLYDESLYVSQYNESTLKRLQDAFRSMQDSIRRNEDAETKL